MRHVPAELLATFEPAADALLDLLRGQVDDGMLAEIAAADYGMNAVEHLRELRRIRDTGQDPQAGTPAPLGWEPLEVLNLMRWSEPDDPAWQPGSAGRRGHLMRAFVCAVLLRAAAEPANAPGSVEEEATLAQLVASVRVLGGDAPAATARFLVWRVTLPREDEYRPFFALALLFLVMTGGAPWPGEQGVARLAEWVVAEEADARARDRSGLAEQRGWLLGLLPYDSRNSLWRSFARQLRAEADRLRWRKARARVERIAARLLGEA